MELKNYLKILIRWWWLILLLTIVAAGAALVVGALTLPVYAATATVLVNQAPHGDLTDAGALVTGQSLAATYVQLLTKRPILEEAIAETRADLTPEQLAGAVQVFQVGDTGVITIQVEDGDPARAAQLANAIPEVFARQNEALQASRYADTIANLSDELAAVDEEISRTQKAIDAIESPLDVTKQAELYRLQDKLAKLEDRHTTVFDSYQNAQLLQAQNTSNIQIVERAQPSLVPVRPQILQSTLLAAVIGLMVGIGFVVLIEYMDDRLGAADQIEALLGAPVLGTVGHFTDFERDWAKQKQHALIANAAPRSPVVEAFRSLRTNLRSSASDRPFRSLLVTSAAPAEGKSTISANLAVIMAQAGLRVLLVDADLRRPTVQRLFDWPNTKGLSNLVADATASWDDLIRPSAVDNLYLLPSGPLPDNPSDLLDSEHFRQLLKTLVANFDLVILDSPPILPVTDAAIVAPLVDGVVIVVDTGNTRSGTLRHAKDQLMRVHGRLLGAVMNKVSAGQAGYPHYYHYYSQSAESKPAKNGRVKPAVVADSEPETQPISKQ
jgi:non-specific protein-tyrosine kinase